MSRSDRSTDVPADPAPSDRLGRALVLLFAVTTGVAVSASYVLQPLLEEIRSDFDTSSSTTSLLVTATQGGYAVGLALLVPLGDRIDRRILAPALMVVCAVALIVAGVAVTFPMLLVASLFVGVFAATAQVVVPWSSSLAAEGERGRVVGTVMSGLLLGILLARVVSGVIAGFGGWRLVLFVTAGLLLVLAAVVVSSTPSDGRRPAEPYGQLLVSVGRLIRTEAVLRRRMVLGFVSMFGFSALWTSVAFLLSGSRGEDYHFSEAAIGLFGLAGVAGAAAAPIVGRLADRGRARLAATVSWLLVLGGWAVLGFSEHTLLALVIGLVVFDFGVQGVQLSNQTAIYSLAPQSRSRVTTAYMVTYFVGAVAGSATSGVAYEAGGWTAVSAVGLTTGVLGLALWGVFARQERPVDSVVPAVTR